MKNLPKILTEWTIFISFIFFVSNYGFAEIRTYTVDKDLPDSISSLDNAVCAYGTLFDSDIPIYAFAGVKSDGKLYVKVYHSEDVNTDVSIGTARPIAEDCISQMVHNSAEDARVINEICAYDAAMEPRCAPRDLNPIVIPYLTYHQDRFDLTDPRLPTKFSDPKIVFNEPNKTFLVTAKMHLLNTRGATIASFIMAQAVRCTTGGVIQKFYEPRLLSVFKWYSHTGSPRIETSNVDVSTAPGTRFAVVSFHTYNPAGNLASTVAHLLPVSLGIDQYHCNLSDRRYFYEAINNCDLISPWYSYVTNASSALYCRRIYYPDAPDLLRYRLKIFIASVASNGALYLSVFDGDFTGRTNGAVIINPEDRRGERGSLLLGIRALSTDVPMVRISETGLPVIAFSYNTNDWRVDPRYSEGIKIITLDINPTRPVLNVIATINPDHTDIRPGELKPKILIRGSKCHYLCKVYHFSRTGSLAFYHNLLYGSVPLDAGTGASYSFALREIMRDSHSMDLINDKSIDAIMAYWKPVSQGTYDDEIKLKWHIFSSIFNYVLAPIYVED